MAWDFMKKVISNILFFGLLNGCVLIDQKENPTQSAIPPNQTGGIEEIVKNVSVKMTASDTVPTAPLLIMQKFFGDTLGLVQFEVSNKRTNSTLVDLYANIPGYATPAKKTVTLKANETKKIFLTPQVTQDGFKKLSEQTTASFDISVTVYSGSDSRKILSETPTFIFLAKDVMFLDPSYLGLLAGWVKPHVGAVDTLIRVAATYHPLGSLFGYQNPTNSLDLASVSRDQVKAIFNALKNKYSIVYINSVISYPNGTQRIKFPEDAIHLKSANCIDGTILFASALENIGLNPYLVIVPGHAYLTWDTWPGSGLVDVLETTMVGTSTFEQANAAGLTEYNNEIQSGHFTSGVSAWLDIKYLRSVGITPLSKKGIGI
jgi:hypothetical protein